MVPALSRKSDGAQRRMKIHEAHVQEWRKWPGTPDRFAQALALEASHAFAEYRQLREARLEEIAQSKRQREQAREALQQIQKQFSLAEQNPVLARAIIATFTGTPHDSWGRESSLEPPEGTEGLRLCVAVQREAAFSQAVERMAQTIDALSMPENPGGRPAEPELDRLILRLSEMVCRAGFEQIAPQSIAIVKVLMDIGRVPRAAFSIKTRIAALAGQHSQTIPLTPAQNDALERVTAACQDCVTEP